MVWESKMVKLLPSLYFKCLGLITPENICHCIHSVLFLSDDFHFWFSFILCLSPSISVCVNAVSSVLTSLILVSQQLIISAAPTEGAVLCLILMI